MEIKFLPTLEWWITKWLHEHGFEDVSARVNPDFEYDFETSSIGFPLALSANVEGWFYNFIIANFDFPYNCDPFITSFFHELGHDQIYMDFSEEEFEEYEKDKEDCAIEVDDDDETREKKNTSYFSLPFEYAATAWGVEYIKTHEDDVAEFWRVCSKMLQWIYKINNVEVD